MRRVPKVVALLVGAVVIAGCSGADSGGDAGGGSADQGTAAEAEGTDESVAAADDGGEESAALEVSLVAASSREIVYYIDVTVEVDDLAAAVQKTVAMAESSGGFVASEHAGSESATLTLRVPSDSHADVVARVEDLGKVLGRSRNAEDVTEQVVDVEARIASQRRSIDRIRDLLDRAANINDVVRIESELASREAELDSLLQRQKELSELTSLATVTVTLVASGSQAADDAEIGFVAGLRGGWNALVEALRVGATAIGALLPFAVVLTAVGIPLGWALRRRRRAPATPPVPRTADQT